MPMEAHEIVTIVVLIAILAVVLVLAFNPAGCWNGPSSCGLQPSCAGVDDAQDTSLAAMFPQMLSSDRTGVYNVTIPTSAGCSDIGPNLGGLSGLVGENGEPVEPAAPGIQSAMTSLDAGFQQLPQAPAGVAPAEWDGPAAATGVAGAVVGDAGTVKANYENAISQMSRIRVRGATNTAKSIGRTVGYTTGVYGLLPKPKTCVGPKPSTLPFNLPEFHPWMQDRQDAIDMEDAQRMLARGNASYSPLIQTL